MEHYPYIYYNEKTGQVVNKRNKDNLPPCKQVASLLSLFTSAHHALELELIAALRAVIEEEGECVAVILDVVDGP